MSRYETFVIRLWMNDQASLSHGEVRHLTTGTGLRFLRVEEALEFIQRIADRDGGHSAEGAVETESNADHLPIDFGSSSSTE